MMGQVWTSTTAWLNTAAAAFNAIKFPVYVSIAHSVQQSGFGRNDGGTGIPFPDAASDSSPPCSVQAGSASLPDCYLVCAGSKAARA